MSYIHIYIIYTVYIICYMFHSYVKLLEVVVQLEWCGRTCAAFSNHDHKIAVEGVVVLWCL